MKNQNNITLYAYLDIEHPMVAWEVAIGRIRSIDITKFEVSIWQYTSLSNYVKYGLDQNFINEIELEYVRKQHFPNRVSRMQGVYFFESYDDAVFALKHWDIPLKENYISEISFTPQNITKVDSEWITSYIDKKTNNSWMNKYWNGEIKEDKPLYEILATGLGVILNYDLRIQAYKNIFELWPYSTPLLAMACCAFQVKNIDDIAKVVPALYPNDNVIKGGYIIDISALTTRKEDIIEAIKICKNDNKYPIIVRPKNPEVFFELPDLSYLEFIFDNIDALNSLRKVHGN
jgi:hypothetical protein